MLDSSRLTGQDLLLALQYLVRTRSVLKIDNPALIKSRSQEPDYIAALSTKFIKDFFNILVAVEWRKSFKFSFVSGKGI